MKEKTNKLLDEIGWQILDELQMNSNISTKELAKKVHLSITATIERIRRMEEAGIICGYKAIVDPRKVGYSITALITLSTAYGNPDVEIKDTILKELPEITAIWSITGPNDFIIEVIVPSLEFLEQLLVTLTKYGHLTTSIVLPSSITNSIKCVNIRPPRNVIEHPKK